MDAIERRAREFHEVYERLAPKFGYETRPCTREFDPESPNGKLMMAVIAAITPPECYVLVPAVCTDAMRDAAYLAAGSPTEEWYGFDEMWSAAIAARPEVPNVND